MASQRELVKELFGAALELKPAERAAFLETACSDSEVKREVEAMLAAAADAGRFLEHPTEDLRNTLRATSGIVIGPYHLFQLIGEGGMGEVWLAEQKQPMRRRVAIKLIKAGMDTRDVVARFESERQVLALMDHPTIAKVFDAGSTPEGRPYFVMEYVPGIPITAYCDKHRLTVHQRMELLIQVCNGVQHAHQKAIIHRDLKPSNILVTEIDEKPMPRIIDFGVAKATTQKLIGGTMYTRVGTLIGTIDYMSPEQADPAGEDIDNRTDVYSLGVVLYELLAGVLPLDFQNLAYDQVLRRLREEDAPPPSTKLQTLGGELAAVAKKRGSDPPSLVRQLRGDPDAISLKAIEKDRMRRYASASGLASDIDRHLHNEAVAAHPAGTAYRARKYIRHHRPRVAAITIAVLTLALLATWWRFRPTVPLVPSTKQLTDSESEASALHLYGTVMDASSRQPIAGALITIDGEATRDEASQSDGSFDVDLASGVHPDSRLRIRVKKTGYADYDQPFIASRQAPIGVSMTALLTTPKMTRQSNREFKNLRGAGADKGPQIRLSSAQAFLKTYGDSTATVIDLSLGNDGSRTMNLIKIKLNVKNLLRYHYDPCPSCSRMAVQGIYNLPFKKIAEGIDEYSISHAVAPNSTERINLVLGGDHSDLSYLARITVSLYLDSGQVLETGPIDVLVQNVDEGKMVPLNELGEAELRTFIESGSNPPAIITPTVIRAYFKDGGRSFASALPSWYMH